MTDAELVSRILTGEEHLFGELVGRYAGAVWAICSGYLANRSDCEDVTQEVFTQAYLRLNTLRRPAAFAGWLVQIGRRRCNEWLRATSRRNAAMNRFEKHIDTLQDTAGADEGLAQEERRRVVCALVRTLPVKTREAMLLCYGADYSAARAAEVLGISPNTLKTRLHYGRKLLRKRFGRELQAALAANGPRKDFTRAILAAIPLGQASWLAGAGIGTGSGVAAAASKPALYGGIAIMSNKMLGGGIALLALLLGALTYSVAVRPTTDDTAKGPAATPGLTEAEPVAEQNGPALRAEEPLQPTPPAPTIEGKDDTPGLDEPPAAVKPASVSGHVNDDAGYPLDGARICVEIVRDGDWNDVIASYAAQANTDGLYEVGGIDVFGDAAVFASAEGRIMQASRIALSPGARRDGVDFTLPQAAHFVAGRVISEHRVPVPEAHVGLMYYGYDEEDIARTEATGATIGGIGGTKLAFAATGDRGYFEIAVPEEGLCDLRVEKDGFGRRFFARIPTGTFDAEFMLRAEGAIAGVVTSTEGEPIEGAAVKVVGKALPGGLAPSAMHIQELPATTVTANTDANGEYLVDGLGEDYIYTVSASAPGPLDTNEDLPDEQGTHHIANTITHWGNMSYCPPMHAKAEGVRVVAGQTTPHVDLVFGSTACAILYGMVTDRTTGAPACPVTVEASALDAQEKSLRGTAATSPDGSYRILIQDLAETYPFRVCYCFVTEGGSAWPWPENAVATIDLGPGDEEEINFTVDAPVTVPVRYMDEDGVSIEGVPAGMREAGGSGGCGGALTSDADGRVTFHGIPPFIALEALAWKSSEYTRVTIGVSEPFTGQPGETLPDVVVICHAVGGIQGVVVDGDGIPFAGRKIACYALSSDGALTEGIKAMLDPQGAFYLPEALPHGNYRRVFILHPCAADEVYVGVVENVDIGTEGITDLGVIATTPVPKQEAASMLGLQE